MRGVFWIWLMVPSQDFETNKPRTFHPHRVQPEGDAELLDLHREARLLAFPFGTDRQVETERERERETERETWNNKGSRG